MSAFEDINGVPASELAFSDPSMNRIVEPGAFKLRVGEHSANLRHEFDFCITE